MNRNKITERCPLFLPQTLKNHDFPVWYIYGLKTDIKRDLPNKNKPS